MTSSCDKRWPGTQVGKTYRMVKLSSFFFFYKCRNFTQSTCCCGLRFYECLIIKESASTSHDDVIKWKHFPRYRPFARGIHPYPVNSPHKGQWRGALMFSLICVWINGWVNNGEAGHLRRSRAHYDVTVMIWSNSKEIQYFPRIMHMSTGFLMFRCGLVEGNVVVYDITNRNMF